MSPEKGALETYRDFLNDSLFFHDGTIVSLYWRPDEQTGWKKVFEGDFMDDRNLLYMCCRLKTIKFVDTGFLGVAVEGQPYEKH